ncbi:MAG: hypothetical protein IT452_11205 [Planctomycetia bacterium]|nr:hypothetical protein [Planctomycetia bacterium]
MREALLLAVAICTTCLTGCIAGAGLDSAGDIREACDFPTTVGASTLVTTVAAPRGHVRQMMPISLMVFGRSVVLRGDSTSSIGVFEVALHGMELTVSKDGSAMVNVNLPSVFSYAPIEVAEAELGGRRVAVCVGRSRASTGRYFLGIYSTDGGVVCEGILTFGEMWNIDVTPTRIDILGATSIRSISLRE